MNAWRRAAGDDELANEILNSQIEFMQELGLID